MTAARRRKNSKFRLKDDPVTGESIEEKSCPNCSRELGFDVYYPVAYFGVRPMRGQLIEQSWCPECRAKKSPSQKRRSPKSHEREFFEQANRTLRTPDEVRSVVRASRKGADADGDRQVAIDYKGESCLGRTISNVCDGDLDIPLLSEGLPAVVNQAHQLASMIWTCYEEAYQARDADRILSNQHYQSTELIRRPIGAMYGQIRSGKTIAMVLTTAIAFDLGFETVVVLCEDHPRVIDYTLDLFRCVDGPLVLGPPSANRSNTWDRDKENVRRRLKSRGCVFICPKEEKHIRELLKTLAEIGADRCPSLIFEDDADPDAPILTKPPLLTGDDPSKLLGISHLLFQNELPLEKGHSLREFLGFNVLVRVAGSPDALLPTRDMRFPLQFFQVLQPADGYVTGEWFYEDSAPYAVLLDDALEGQAERGGDWATPGLQLAIAYFLLAAQACQIMGIGTGRRNTFLCHTAAKKADIERLSSLVTSFTTYLANQMEDSFQEVCRSVNFRWAYEELSYTVAGLPEFECLMGEIAEFLPTRKVIPLSPPGQAQSPDSRFNFLVGGNALIRGAPLEDLLVTFMVPQARLNRLDALLQHTAMFGYKEGLLPFSRLFLRESQHVRFGSTFRTIERLQEIFET